ncbi:MAG: hypothetical protein H7257_02835, partial [Taibaiella sp.]|nr:hypothetical protein [Taibaiella sp.]
MRNFFLLILLCAGLSASAQQYFNKRYTLFSHGVSFSAVIPRDNKYYTVGCTWDSSNTSPSPQITGIKFTILDNAGNVLRDTVYQRPGIKNFYQQFNNAFFSLPDKGFLLAVEQDYELATGIAYAM